MIRTIVVLLCLGLIACTADEGGASAPSMASEDGDGMDEAIIQEVVAQAATEHDVDADDIEVLSADAVTWRDGSLGCPEDGMAYTQALVPGYRVVLDIAGTTAHYHAASQGDFFRCDNPQDSFDAGTMDR